MLHGSRDKSVVFSLIMFTWFQNKMSNGSAQLYQCTQLRVSNMKYGSPKSAFLIDKYDTKDICMIMYHNTL